jgi:hypothetical protein
MTGQDLFSALTILILIICIVLHVKRKIELFDDYYWGNVFVTSLFMLSLITTLFMLGVWFSDNWSTKVL